MVKKVTLQDIFKLYKYGYLETVEDVDVEELVRRANQLRRFRQTGPDNLTSENVGQNPKKRLGVSEITKYTKKSADITDILKNPKIEEDDLKWLTKKRVGKSKSLSYKTTIARKIKKLSPTRKNLSYKKENSREFKIIRPISKVPKAQVPNAPVPNAPVPNAPVPNAPVPNAPVPNVPVPNVPIMYPPVYPPSAYPPVYPPSAYPPAYPSSTYHPYKYFDRDEDEDDEDDEDEPTEEDYNKASDIITPISKSERRALYRTLTARGKTLSRSRRDPYSRSRRNTYSRRYPLS